MERKIMIGHLESTPNLRMGITQAMQDDRTEEELFYKDLPQSTRVKIETNITKLKSEGIIKLADLKQFGVQRLEALFGGQLVDAKKLIGCLGTHQLKTLPAITLSTLLNHADSVFDLFESDVLSTKKTVDPDKEKIYLHNPIVRDALAPVEDEKEFESFFMKDTLLSTLLKLDSDKLDFFLTAGGKRLLHKFGNNSIILKTIHLETLKLFMSGDDKFQIVALDNDIVIEILTKVITYGQDDIEKYPRGVSFLSYSKNIALAFLNNELTLEDADLLSNKVFGPSLVASNIGDKIKVIDNILSFYKNNVNGSSKFSDLKPLKAAQVREIFKDFSTISEKLQPYKLEIKEEAPVSPMLVAEKKDSAEVQQVIQEQRSSCCIIV